MAVAAGVRVQDTENDDIGCYTFMGYKPRARELLPFGYGDEYPAFHTYRGGLDRCVIDLMRPLFNKGVRPEALSSLMLEMHTKAAVLPVGGLLGLYSGPKGQEKGLLRR